MALMLLSLGVALFPFYAFPSGGVQPAHLVLAFFFALLFSVKAFPSSPWVLFLLGLVAYIFSIEYYYFLNGASPKGLVNSIYFLYNTALASAVFVACRENGIRSVKIGVFISVISIILLYFCQLFLGESGGRFSGFFNNPNQLGFFSVVLVSLSFLFYRSNVIHYLSSVGLVAASVILAILSLSKAAMIPVFISAFFVLMPANGGRLGKSAWAALAITFSFSAAAMYIHGVFDDYRVVSRLSGMFSESDSSLEARGYLVFVSGGGLQKIFGMGSENTKMILGGSEIHSTLASIYTNYGAVGFFLFACAFGIWAKKIWSGFGLLGVFCITGPAMLYGLTHNGSRFSIFWILFGASLAMADIRFRRLSSSRDHQIPKEFQS